MKKKRTLYECSHARVKGERILCRRGHPFSAKSEDGGIEAKRLARGEPLTFLICQVCGDFDCMGPPVPEEEKGWLKKEVSGNGRRPGEALRETVAACGR
jgi:hypothetical protein